MTKKKICLIGSFSVGKTSLISQFVEGFFSDVYRTTVGVKIDRKVVQVDGGEVKLMVWDLAGEDEFQRLRASYLKGASGVFFVADGTRSETLQQTRVHIENTREMFPGIVMRVLLNKVDLIADWEIEGSETEDVSGVSVCRTSAKTGEGVDAAFLELAREMLATSSKSGTFL